MNHRLTPAPLTLAVSLALTGCVGQNTNPAQPDAPTTSIPCPEQPAVISSKTTTTQRGGVPVIAVATQITGTGSPEVATTRATAFDAILNTAKSSKARLLADVITTSTAGANGAVNASFATDQPNDLLRTSALTCTAAKARTSFAGLVNSTASGPTNIFAAVTVLRGHLQGITTSEINVVLFSNMTNTALPLDFTSAAFGTMSPDQLLDQAQHLNLIPTCTKWRVHIYGVGDPNDSQYARVRSFWLKFFKACGGAVVAYDSQLTTFPLDEPIEDGPPQLVAPATTRISFSAPPPAVDAVPSDPLFNVGDATLRPDAASVLEGIRRFVMTTHPAGAITVTGYTDNTSNTAPGGNGALSLARARAVVDWLIANGVPAGRLTAKAGGETNPKGDNSTAAGRQQNRRVEIAVAPTT